MVEIDVKKLARFNVVSLLFSEKPLLITDAIESIMINLTLFIVI